MKTMTGDLYRCPHCKEVMGMSTRYQAHQWDRDVSWRCPYCDKSMSNKELDAGYIKPRE